MHIKRLEIKGFGSLKDFICSPGPGLNLIHGPNEAGKSTLLAFIRAMLYGLRGGRKGKDSEMSLLRRFEPWNQGVYQGIIEYLLDDGRSFKVGRNFAKGTIRIQDAHHNDITGTFAQDRETGPLFAYAHLGIDADTYIRTLEVGQAKAALDLNAKKGLMDSLLRLKENGQDEATYRLAEAALQSALLERVGTERSSVRPMDRIKERLSLLEKEAHDIKTQRMASRESALAHTRAKIKMNELRVEIDNLYSERSVLRTCLNFLLRQEITDRLKIAADKMAELNYKISALNQEFTTLSAKQEESKSLTVIDADNIAALPFELGRLRELKNVAERFEVDIKRKQAEIEELSSELPTEALWSDTKRLNAVVSEYMLVRELVGSNDERQLVLSEARPVKIEKHTGMKRMYHIILAAGLSLVVMISVTVLLALSLTNMANSSSGANSIFLASLGASSLVFFAAAVIKLRRGVGSNTRTGKGTGSPAADGAILATDDAGAALSPGREDIIRWNASRKALETLVAEAGMDSIQNFLNMKHSVDIILSRIAELKQDNAENYGHCSRASYDICSIMEAISEVLRSCGINEDVPEHTAVSQAQSVFANFKELKQRLTEVSMRLESYKSEKESLERNMSLLLEREKELNEQYSDNVAPGSHQPIALYPQIEADTEVGIEHMSESSLKQSLLDNQTEIESATKVRTAIELEIATLEARLERLPTEDRLQQVIEELDGLAARKNALESYGESLHTAIRVLSQAAQEVRHGIAPKLDNLTGEILSGLSGGKYKKVGVDDKLSIRVEAMESSIMPAVSSLSGGTADQVWLSLRIAAIMLLEEGNEKLPIFLDEPFSYYDDKRTLAALSWLRDRAGGRQIFLFTCRARDMEMAESVFAEKGHSVEVTSLGVV